MNRTSTFIAVGVALAMLVPSGLATWGSYGGSEPDNRYDAEGGFMFTDGPGTATDQVYFNVYVVEGPAGVAAPNSATLGGRVMPPGEDAFNAILGVWADCNQDGFIGLADGALQEYRIEVSQAAGLPIDTDVCPELADTPENAGTIHNDGSWITELIPIIPTDASDMANNTNYRYLADKGVKIWGDFGEPKTPTGTLAAGCRDSTINPPFGNHKTSGPGGMLQQIDCDMSVLAASPDALWARVADADTTGTIAGNTPHPSSLYTGSGPLNIDIMGSDDSHNSQVSGEQDCSADPILSGEAAYPLIDMLASNDPFGLGLEAFSANGTGVRNPGALSVNPGGSPAGTINETIEETPGADDCDTSDDAGHDYYGNGITEVQGGSAGGTAAIGKANAQMNFAFAGTGSRGGCDATSLWDNFGVGDNDPIPGDSKIVPALHCGEPSSEGLAQPFLLLFDDNWWSGTNWVVRPGAPALTRGSGSDTTVAPDVSPARWDAFYAHITVTGVTTPHGTPGVYGAEWCVDSIGHNAGIQNGWDCDPANWNLDSATGLPDDAKALEGTVGDAYELRDVGCYDNTVVSKDSTQNPMPGQDLGVRSASLLVDPTHGCW